MEYYIFGLLPYRRSSSLKYLFGLRYAVFRSTHSRLRPRPLDDARPSFSGRMRAPFNPVAGGAVVFLYVLHWTDPQLLFGSDVPWEVHVHVRNGRHPQHHLDLTDAFCHE